MNQDVPVEPIRASDEVHVSTTEPTTKSVEDIAKEVVAGMWGRGQMRQRRLTDAGYDPAAVKREVDKIFGRE